MKKKLTYTNKFNKNMIPCIYKGSCCWSFIFVDTKNNTFFKSESATTIAWLRHMGISQSEFTDKCWNTYDMLQDANIKRALVSFFVNDDAKIYSYAYNIDLEEMGKFM